MSEERSNQREVIRKGASGGRFGRGEVKKALPGGLAIV